MKIIYFYNTVFVQSKINNILIYAFFIINKVWIVITQKEN